MGVGYLTSKIVGGSTGPARRRLTIRLVKPGLTCWRSVDRFF